MSSGAGICLNDSVGGVLTHIRDSISDTGSDVGVSEGNAVGNLSGEHEEEGGGDGDLLNSAEKLEYAAVCLDGNRLGCARYVLEDSRVEVFEVAAYCDVETFYSDPETSGYRMAPSYSQRRSLPILSWHDIPSSLLWFVRYLQVFHPVLLLPDRGNELLFEIVGLVGGCEVMSVDAKTGFSAHDAFLRLQAMYPRMQTVEFASRFSVQYRAMLSAMSALLCYAVAVRLNIADVVEKSPMHVLYLEKETAQCLQFTRLEPHPCGHQGVGGPKEGHSLLSVVDHTQSVQGRFQLKQWFSLPTCDVAELHARLHVSSFFVEPGQRDNLTRLRRALCAVRPTSRLFILMRSGKGTLRHYQSLHRTIRGMLTVYEVLLPLAHHVPFFRKVVDSYNVKQLQSMANLMVRGIADLCGRSYDTNIGHRRAGTAGGDNAGDHPIHVSDVYRVSVCSGMDPTGALEELREGRRQMSVILERKAESALSDIEPILRQRMCLQCLYVEPHGYLICAKCDQLVCTNIARSGWEDWLPLSLPNEDMHADAAEVSLQEPLKRGRYATPEAAFNESLCYLNVNYGWEMHHQLDGICYFKTPSMVEMDMYVGDLQQRIEQRVAELRRSIDQELLYRSLFLIPPTRVLAELDCLLSFAHCAIQYQWCLPSLHTEPGVLSIEKGWHAVLARESGVEMLKPFSLDIRNVEDRLCLFTGANGSGKSALLGAVAQIVFLAQIGCFVPAVSASISPVGSIFTVSSAHRFELGCASSFYVECTALSRILYRCESNLACISEHNAQRWRELHGRVTGAVASSPSELEELHGMNQLLQCCSSLVILDEFGKGTSPAAGRALLGAALRYWAGSPTLCNEPVPGRLQHLRQSLTRPIVLCATHFTEVMDVHLGADAGLHPWTDFPFEEVVVYDMRCTPVYAAPPSLPLNGGSFSSRVSTFHQCAGPSKLSPAAPLAYTVDFVPTFEPHRVTVTPGLRKQEYFAYRGQMLEHGPALGRHCGLEGHLLDLWESSVRIIHMGHEPQEDGPVEL